MSHLTYLKRVSKTIEMIKAQELGSSLALSQYFGVSERTIVRLIKDIFTETKITYDSKKESYVFLGASPENILK
ncbi:HTH domain-containing protein [Marivirga sp. S37H4]|uniref:HTH domain-containing protein n=1 Tax=Marivirga aurantiaca TaxID=2802615 RepID=A0A935C8W7_9BACT|nr:HTH domain-containing protein [Marivirga aurantiaca]MBK6265674.1 HTH domain-containing protein [Marivirga aurantiaca]